MEDDLRSGRGETAAETLALKITDRAAFIRANTSLLVQPLVPEVRLYLAHEAVPLWMKTEEELGVHAVGAVKRGELWFQFVDGLKMHVAVFHATHHEREAVETEEAIPLWTPIDNIPFDEMWADDRHWLHRMLVTDENFLGRFTFDGDVMLWHEVTWSDESPWTPPRAEAGGMECGFAC